ncbi:MAG: MaoC family dehydratase [Rhodocyclales bacterium]|nr:MaoC family dehydratase [Rhodocyclales bacterium]
MTAAVRLNFRDKPGFLGFMAQMWRPKPGGAALGPLPEIVAEWRGRRGTRAEQADFLQLSGMPADSELSILYPHTASFPLLMALLSHPAFPLPIWRVLQVRNRLALHEAIAPDAVLDFTVRSGERRVLKKGIEIDLQVTARRDGRAVFEATNSFYARGRFGPAGAEAPASPVLGGPALAEWRMPEHGRLGYSRLSGDFNPLHLSDAYARRQGYARAFAHPQRAIGQCLGHLGGALAQAPLCLETWIKGQVFYGARVALRAEPEARGGTFALHVDGDERPAIVGRYVHPNSSKESSA